jgi:uncharacterized pyridoxal phosphate-containing UPF0001 family protein
MSGDFNIALDAGSNMIRIGTSLFGERKKWMIQQLFSTCLW